MINTGRQHFDMTGIKWFQECSTRDLNTPIYKYLSLLEFLRLTTYKEISFTRVTEWLDYYEGHRFDVIKKANPGRTHSEKCLEDFFGCSWTLQEEDPRCYDNKCEAEAAIKELEEFGSASMWQSYCKNGGVRIKTTIRKILKIVEPEMNDFEGFIGVVEYEPLRYWGKTLNTPTPALISGLFKKNISFRHESEFRFILVAKDKRKESREYFSIANLYDLIDEILVSPSTAHEEWISQMLHRCGSNISLQQGNRKNEKKFCRISCLYGDISAEL